MRILVIEDDPDVARLVRLGLATSGIETTLVSDGRAGVAQAAVGSFAAVILDLSLPDIDGMNVLRALREVSEIPILILTARGSVADRVEGLDQGADDYMLKPFAPEELEARVRAVIRRSHRTPSPAGVLAAFGIEIDAKRREATYAGTPLELTRREFDLLKSFVENQGIVLTRDMLLEQVWGWGYAGGSNIIDVYVGSLRTKLQAQGAPSLIQTVRGVGYALRPDRRDSP